ncbi:MAG TPA: hypothetical protein VHE13_06975 [Opitutus sp.]|nr:hypothetical protein [Opitutus sp.]
MLFSLSLPLRPAAAEPAPAAPAIEADATFAGRVVQTMDADRYTYVEVDTGSHRLWAASTHVVVHPGDTVAVQGGMPMINFHSKVLKRDFDLVYFTGKLLVNPGNGTDAKAAAALPPGHPPVDEAPPAALPPNHPPVPGQPAPAPTLDLTGIRPAEGGKTVADIVTHAVQLAGQSVKVRGRVVKYNEMVMGKNWLHIHDASGSANGKDNDLTVTTANPAKVGDLVLVTGKVSTNRDFGAGYKYAVILEDAAVAVE